MELIDTHCHLTFDSLACDIEDVLKRSRAAGVTGWVTVGTDMEENRQAVELAGKNRNLYAAVGVHPHEAETVTADTISQLKELAQNSKVVAIGETGLDYHYNFSKKSAQERTFAKQLEIASELKLPVIIHCREAFDQTMEVLERFDQGIERIVFHCFSGSVEQAKIVLAKGYYISLTSVVTFKNAEKTCEVAKMVPLERLMIETDSPYMSPEPMRKQKVNEPALLVHTAKFIAELKHMDLELFSQQITANTKQFFNLPGKSKC